MTESSRTWLVTGCAGFIGSNLIESLLKTNQRVVGLDNFSTGSRGNIEDVLRGVTPEQASAFRLVEGDIRDLSVCTKAFTGVDYVLHQAALGSVPRSIERPIDSHDVNVTGHLNMLVAARDAKVRRFVYASSSSVYGDHPDLPKVEAKVGSPLSPYAVTKQANELYARVFSETYGMETVGLRYFNVFGRRQDPLGPYAAVIPLWFNSLLKGKPVNINGDGETSRDFTYIDDVVQANLLAAKAPLESKHRVFNVACGRQTTLNELYRMIRDQVASVSGSTRVSTQDPVYRDFRAGDIRHSLADIGEARKILGYNPRFTVREGIAQAAQWYLALFSND